MFAKNIAIVLCTYKDHEFLTRPFLFDLDTTFKAFKRRQKGAEKERSKWA
jgi:hypothetical protein